MSYSEAQRTFYATRPANRSLYTIVEFHSVIPGIEPLRLIASGVNGPYAPLVFRDSEGVSRTYMPVRADVPDTTTQDPTSTVLATLRFSRVASQAREFIELIESQSIKPTDRIIRARIALYESSQAEAYYERWAYVGRDGVAMDMNDVTIPVELTNPASRRFAPFYTVDQYPGLSTL